MKYILFDMETDGLDYTKCHCIAYMDFSDPDTVHLTTVIGEFTDYVAEELRKGPVTLVAHNGFGFDFPALQALDPSAELIWTHWSLDYQDTSVLSKLHDFNKFSTHSLAELGEHLHCKKDEYNGGWDEYTEEMGEYCKRDVEVLRSVFQYFEWMLHDEEWWPAIELENATAKLCYRMSKTGMGFNNVGASALLFEVATEMEKLEQQFEVDFPPTQYILKECKLRTRADGTYYKNVVDDFDTYEDIEVDHDAGTYTVFDEKPFNPGSPRDRIDVLWDAGWKPFDKTKGHQQALREAWMAKKRVKRW